MEITPGVYAHFIETQQFQTTHLKCRFSTPITDSRLMARRALVAQMMAAATEKYETNRDFRTQLANLYGASLSTSVSVKGNLHLIDVDLSFINDHYLPQGQGILEQVLDLLEEILFHPLSGVERYHTKTFAIEQANLINSLRSDSEDPFYVADLGLKGLYFQDRFKQVSVYGDPIEVVEEDAFSVYQEWRRLMAQDSIDIFVIGDVDTYHLVQRFVNYHLPERQTGFPLVYSRKQDKIVHEKIVSTDNTQSIVELGYSLPFAYGDDLYIPFLVFNGLLAAFPHSKLFTNVREKEGLAYTISSRYDIFSHFYKIYAGIDLQNRSRVLRLIHKELMALKLGRFTDHELETTKRLLKNSALLAEDNPQNRMEQAYHQALLGETYVDFEQWQTAIDQVSKKDIMVVAKAIKLQAVYILEGRG